MTMNNQRNDEIKKRMEERTTEDLLNIWVTNNHDEWSDDAFIVVRQILSERNAPIPPQNAPSTKPKPKSRGFRNWAIVLLILGSLTKRKIILFAAGSFPLAAACIAISICLGPAVAFMWHRLALRKPLATGFRYVFGSTLLGVGTFTLTILGDALLIYMVGTDLPPLSVIIILLESVKLLVFATTFLLPAFLLCFKRSPKKV